MRKSLLSVSMLCTAFVMNAQTIAPPVVENFDGAEFPPSGWTQQQFVGSQSWTKSTNPTMYIGKGSAYAMISAMSQTALVSPGIRLPDTGIFNMKFLTKFMFPDPDASFEVWISDDGCDKAENFEVLKKLQGDDEISDKEWKEISLDIPAEYNGKDIWIAFVTSTGQAGFYAWAVDEVELIQLVDEPVFYGEPALVGNAAFNNLPFPSVTGYEIKNKGGSPLIIESQVSASGGIHLANLPLTVESGKSAVLNVELDAHASSIPNGVYNGFFTFECNDPVRPQVSVDFTAAVESATVSRYLNEGFDYSSGVPEEWSVDPATGVYSFSVKSGRGINGGNALNCALVDNFKTAAVRTGYVNMGTDPRLRFWYRLTDRLTGEATGADMASMTVCITDDGGFTWHTVYNMAPGQHEPSAEFSVKDIDLSAFAGKVCMAEISFTQEVSGAFFDVDLDNVSLGTAPASDLAAFSISGNTLPSVGNQETYTVTVFNNGRDMQEGSTWSIGL